MRSGSGAHHGISAPRPFQSRTGKEEDFDVKAAPPGTIKDIMMASAYFPGFKQEKLGGKTYLDGGSVNNVPVDLLTDRGI